MTMLNERIDSLIAESMKNRDSKRTAVLRAIKDAFLVEQKSVSHVKWGEAIEIGILNRMVKQRLDSYGQYKAAGRNDLADIEAKEVIVLRSFLPFEATDEEIDNAILQVITEKGWGDSTTGPQIPKKCMGEAIRLVKERLTNVNGKTLADAVKRYIDNQ